MRHVGIKALEELGQLKSVSDAPRMIIGTWLSDFWGYNWKKVYIGYCDGASFGGIILISVYTR